MMKSLCITVCTIACLPFKASTTPETGTSTVPRGHLKLSIQACDSPNSGTVSQINLSAKHGHYEYSCTVNGLDRNDHGSCIVDRGRYIDHSLYHSELDYLAVTHDSIDSLCITNLTVSAVKLDTQDVPFEVKGMNEFCLNLCDAKGLTTRVSIIADAKGQCEQWQSQPTENAFGVLQAKQAEFGQLWLGGHSKATYVKAAFNPLSDHWTSPYSEGLITALKNNSDTDLCRAHTRTL
ncbi:hypothetical protein [Echinimonas agarilytica]|uniref:Uncharacterized protein n=1 Tax=Echinimonas agarilytica TaxID=1215918 RepID=A0AA41WBD3_9GAMM|nr:hypothetical protein [Echinimonas agarilytica]MCM2681246.1 hypothetical protein [Echinimonas agarilytica]